MNSNQLIYVNTDEIIPPTESDTLIKSRKQIYNSFISKAQTQITVFIIAFNRLEKTKVCVESVLENTKDLDHELVLIDNGSTDKTSEYFQSIIHPKKTIVRISKNINGVYAVNTAVNMFKSRYFVLIPNDVVVTKNWLSNLLKCMESNDSIGYVTPASSNISNLQQVDFSFKDYDDLQEKAAIFNKSDPCKWQERLRLINIVTLLKRELIDSVGIFDFGFFHDFGEDDYSTRVRRSGYKMMLCTDTFIHHNHVHSNPNEKAQEQYKKSLEIGRKNFTDKYYGIDAWDDITNFELNLINMLPAPTTTQNINILGVDVRCGTPILEIRNFLRRHSVFESRSYAFTTQAKYYQDLLYVTEGNVQCDRIDYTNEYYPMNSFDYIILGEPVNYYPRPIKLLDKLLELAKPGSWVLFKLKNVSDLSMFLNMLGTPQNLDNNLPSYISLSDLHSCLKLMGVSNISVKAQQYNIDTNTKEHIKRAIKQTKLAGDANQSFKDLATSEYLFCIQKPVK